MYPSDMVKSHKEKGACEGRFVRDEVDWRRYLRRNCKRSTSLGDRSARRGERWSAEDPSFAEDLHHRDRDRGRYGTATPAASAKLHPARPSRVLRRSAVCKNESDSSAHRR